VSASGLEWDATRLFARADVLGNRDGAASFDEVHASIAAIDEPDVFQSSVRPADGTLREGELQLFGALFAEHAADAAAPDDTRSVWSFTEHVGPLAHGLMQRYDANADGVISLANETRARMLDATSLLAPADLTEDGAVGLNELQLRLREMDRHYYVGLGDHDAGRDGIIDSKEHEASLDERG
jgi:hypothetical protein